MISAALAFAIKNLGLISQIIQEGITIGPDIVKIIEDAYTTTKKIAEENRVPSQAEIATLDALEEYWRGRLHSDDDLIDK